MRGDHSEAVTVTRRSALQAVVVIAVYLHGKPIISADQTQRPSGTGMSLVLDGLDGIVLQYRGQRIVIQPAEIMAAFTPEPTSTQPMQLPYPRSGK